MTDSTSNPALAMATARQVMQRFVGVDKTMPDKRPPDARRGDFGEIYGEYRGRHSGLDHDRWTAAQRPRAGNSHRSARSPFR